MNSISLSLMLLMVKTPPFPLTNFMKNSSIRSYLYATCQVLHYYQHMLILPMFASDDLQGLLTTDHLPHLHMLEAQPILETATLLVLFLAAANGAILKVM